MRVLRTIERCLDSLLLFLRDYVINRLLHLLVNIIETAQMSTDLSLLEDHCPKLPSRNRMLSAVFITKSVVSML